MFRVALIIERADVGRGGAERSIAELAWALRGRGLHCTTLAATGLADDNTHILCSKSRHRRTPLSVFAQAIRTHLEQHRYDIVHSTLPLTFADLYQPRGGSYVEATQQNAASYEQAWRVAIKQYTRLANKRRQSLLAAERILCQDTSVIIAALSDYVRQHFRAYYELGDERLIVIPNGVKPAEPASCEQVAAFRESLGPWASQQDRPILLFAANNFRLKGLGPLLQAWARVTERPSRTAVLIIVGNDRRRHYRRLARRLGIEDRVTFVGPISSIGPALAICRAAVLPTWYDPCSRFILEALAAGKPVITTRFNGAAERFVDGRHGRILGRPDDIEGLAAAMTQMLDDGWITRAKEAIATDNLKEAVSIEYHAEALVGLYQHILDERKGAQV